MNKHIRTWCKGKSSISGMVSGVVRNSNEFGDTTIKRSWFQALEKALVDWVSIIVRHVFVEGDSVTTIAVTCAGMHDSCRMAKLHRQVLSV